MSERNLTVTAVELDFRSNRLLLVLDQRTPLLLRSPGTYPATIDVGTGGRLIGVEFLAAYLQIADDQALACSQVRSAEVEVQLRADGRIAIGRHGPGYEISFPSGNQCWIGGSGVALCSRLVDDAANGGG